VLSSCGTNNLVSTYDKWEKDAFRSRQRSDLGVDTKRKCPPTSTLPRRHSIQPRLPQSNRRRTLPRLRVEISRMELRGVLDRFQGLQSRGRHQHRQWQRVLTPGANATPTRSCSPASRLLQAGSQVRPRRQEQQVQNHPLFRLHDSVSSTSQQGIIRHPYTLQGVLVTEYRS
jgi:hypothetical protein